jgi:hypothetical protein
MTVSPKYMTNARPGTVANRNAVPPAVFYRWLAAPVNIAEDAVGTFAAEHAGVSVMQVDERPDQLLVPHAPGEALRAAIKEALICATLPGAGSSSRLVTGISRRS